MIPSFSQPIRERERVTELINKDHRERERDIRTFTIFLSHFQTSHFSEIKIERLREKKREKLEIS